MTDPWANPNSPVLKCLLNLITFTSSKSNSGPRRRFLSPNWSLRFYSRHPLPQSLFCTPRTEWSLWQSKTNNQKNPKQTTTPFCSVPPLYRFLLLLGHNLNFLCPGLRVWQATEMPLDTFPLYVQHLHCSPTALCYSSGRPKPSWSLATELAALHAWNTTPSILTWSFSSFGAFSNHLSKQHAPPSSQANVQHTTWIRFPSHHLLPSVMVLFLCLIMHDCLSTSVPFWRAEKGIFSLLWPQYLTCNQWRDQQNHNHSTLIVLEIPFSNTFFPPQIWAKGDE